MFKHSRTFKNTRAILIMVFALALHFALANMAAGTAYAKTQAAVQAAVTHQLAAQSGYEIDQNSIVLYEEIREDGDDGGDADDEPSTHVDVDEFIATLAPLDVLYLVASYPIEDLRLTLSAYDRGVDYPPDLRA
jgi:hypothetical protein